MASTSGKISQKTKGNNQAPLPFLKWAGGKRKLANLIMESFPNSFDSKNNHYFEPFIGGGALMFALGNVESKHFIEGRRIHINDMNPDLINAYRVIRDDVNALIRALKYFENKNDSESFYKVRSTSFSSPTKQAARFIYLNKTCFNGLWRVNSQGNFNVPFGHYKNPKILDEHNLRLCSERLKNAKITLGSFQKAVEKAKAGDLVYFDPPYIPLTKTAAFSQYAKEDFNLDDQTALRDTISQLTKRGVLVILSNSDTPQTREIFGKSLNLRQILVARTISAKALSRKPVHEVLGTNFTISNQSPLTKHREIK